MKILSIESSSNVCGVAISENYDYIDSINEYGEHLHDKYLAQMTFDILAKNNIKLNDIDFISFNIGPGSFTGLRIGAALIKGLTFNSNIRIIPLSYFDIIFYNIYEKIDLKNFEYMFIINYSGKENYYFCKFDINEQKNLSEKKIFTKDEIISLINPKVLIAGGAVTDFKFANTVEDYQILSADMQIIPSKYFILKNNITSSEKLEILYINQLSY